MFFAMDEEGFNTWKSNNFHGTFLECAYVGSTFNEVANAIMHDAEDWYNNTGDIEDPTTWYVFDEIGRRKKVVIDSVPSVTFKWSVVEE